MRYPDLFYNEVKSVEIYTHPINPDPLTAEPVWTGFS